MFASSRSLHLFQLRQRHGSQARHCTRHIASGMCKFTSWGFTDLFLNMIGLFRLFTSHQFTSIHNMFAEQVCVWFWCAFFFPFSCLCAYCDGSDNTLRFDSVLSCRPMGSFKLTSGQGKNLNQKNLSVHLPEGTSTWNKPRMRLRRRERNHHRIREDHRNASCRKNRSCSTLREKDLD